ncbi:unnamed protein product [Brachionus calyciflorus]|uniref:Beta-lactamase-related domain-containing protein n=1 Tax=Brachionus calyciflorus TaxID=104777 RepID=A0A814G6F7_9BILA|nr:unnamed protein product [Brachionus calyciflorus]
MKNYFKLFKNNKFILTSSSIASFLGVGYYVYKNEVPLYSYSLTNDIIFEDRFKKANRLIQQYKELYGVPAVIVQVTKNGQVIYSKAIGYSDVENNLKASEDTIMRIASISKPIACLIACKLYENGKLDLDKSINDYLKDIPKFTFNDKEVIITPRQLMAHTGGIRHYKDNNNNNNSETSDANLQEFYLNKNFPTTKDALELFLKDDLKYEPGTQHLYTTFGYTLLSAVLEKVSSDTPFPKLLEDFFKKVGLNETFLDKNEPIIPNRSKYYMRDSKGKLVNVPYVDNSYKWAGGGLLSNVNDLTKFGNLMLKFYQTEDSLNKFIKQSTIMSEMWTTQSKPNKNGNDNLLSEPNEITTYGLGWCLVMDERKNLKYVYHTGGAVGASSCLMIVPESSDTFKSPKGTVVAVLCNSQNVSEIAKFTLSIARIFSDNNQI